jgi:two-component system, OmpR family, response regulator
VLLVEDDPRLAQELVRVLKRAGHEVELRASLTGVVSVAAQAQCDVVLLDLVLPDGDGLEVLPQLRAQSAVPVLVISGRPELEARLQSFRLGAIDFLPKPFHPEELLARLDVRLGHKPARSATAQVGPALVEIDRRRVSLEGEDVDLTHAELSLLLVLLEHRPNPVSRRQLAQLALGSPEVSERTIDSHITRVRAKLRAGGARLKTVWRVGYALDPEPGPGP